MLDVTDGIELRPLSPPAELWVPLLAAGTRALPAGTPVRRGQSVQREPRQPGEPLALSPFPGVITGEREVQLTSGRRVSAAVLRSGSLEQDTGPSLTATAFSEQITSILSATPDALSRHRESILAAGVWVSRPTSPDLQRQLAQAQTFPSDVLLCTALDPDPHLPVCQTLAAMSPAELVAGMVMLARWCGARRATLVLQPSVSDRAKRELARLLSEASRIGKTHPQPLSAHAVTYANQYPRGDVSLLMTALLRRKLPPGELPTARGTLVVDAATALAVGRAVRFDAPVLDVVLGVTCHTSGKRGLFRAPIGTRVGDVLFAAGITSGPGECASLGEVRIADVLQERTTTTDAVISASDLYLHAMPAELLRSAPPDPCIRCGWCAEACPTQVHPAAVLEAAQVGSPSLALRAGVRSCIECGLCQYVCPSRLPLLKALRVFTPLREKP